MIHSLNKQRVDFLRAITLPGLAMAVLLVIAACGGGRTTAQQGAGQISVVTTFYPLEYFVAQVGGDHVAVLDLVQPGVDPHDFDPTPRDVQAIDSAKVFVYNAAGLEAWVDRLLASEKPKGVVVAATQGLDVMKGGTAQGADAPNPHVWLDPVLAQQEVKNIRDGLIKADHANTEAYNANAARLIDQLAALDQQFRAGLQTCNTRTFVVSHDTTSYFAERYNLESLSIAGLSPDSEPNAATLATLADTMQQKRLKYVFTETLVNPALAETLAREVGAQTLVFNPLEGLTKNDIAAGKDYLSVMKENLASLRIGLGCSQSGVMPMG